MTRDDLFIALGNTKSNYLLAAAASMQVKPRPVFRPRLRYAIIAASLVLLIAMIPIVIMMGNTPFLDVNDLPNAQPFDRANNFFYPDDAKMFESTDAIQEREQKLRRWPNEALSNHTVVIGKATDISSVMIEDGDIRYHIVTLTVNVEENHTDPQNTKPYKAVYACRYEKNPTYGYYEIAEPYTTCGLNFYQDMGREFLEDKTSLFLIDPVEGRTLDIGGTTIDLSQYGDCYMTVYALVQDNTIRLLSKRGVLCSETAFREELAKRNGTYVPSTTEPDLFELPDAIRFPSSQNFDTSNTYPLPPKEDFIKAANEQYTVLTGTRYNLSRSLVSDNDLYWNLTAFNLWIEQKTPNYKESQHTVRVMYAHQYKKENGKYMPITQNVDYGIMERKTNCGFYVLKKITNQSITIGNTTYPLSDYADYIIQYVFDDYGTALMYSNDPENYTEDNKISYEEFGLYDPTPVVPPTPQYTIDVSLPIPGAEKITSSDNFDTSKIHPLPPQDEFIRDANEKYTALTGGPSDTAHYLIPDGEIYWHITVTVIKIKKCTDRYTGVNFTKLISVHQYKKENGKYVSIVPKDDNGIKLMNGTFGFYVLEKLTDQSITVGNTTYPLADYADYMIAYTFLSDYDHFLYSNDIYNYTMDNKIPYETLGIYERDLPKVESIKPPSTPNNDPAITTEIAPAPITPTE